jgi:hypothetical protein
LPLAFMLFLAWLILQSWTWRQHAPLKCQLTFNTLCGVTSHKVELFITATVRTSNPIYMSLCPRRLCLTTLFVFLVICEKALSWWDGCPLSPITVTHKCHSVSYELYCQVALYCHTA